jgi:chitin synthase
LTHSIFSFRSETGSGKSENRRPAIKSLLELSVRNPGKKIGYSSSSGFVLETFGNACTLFNPNASCFGKYTELQFSDQAKLTGVKTLDYYLERNGVAAIVYYLIAGASPEERLHLHLLDETMYRYLGSNVNQTR